MPVEQEGASPHDQRAGADQHDGQIRDEHGQVGLHSGPNRPTSDRKSDVAEPDLFLAKGNPQKGREVSGIPPPDPLLRSESCSIPIESRHQLIQPSSSSHRR
jgi:hypothetical protein